MKRFFAILFVAILGLVVLGALAASSALFFKPELVLNEKNLDLLLSKTQILKEWSWSSAKFEHHYISWNHRRLGAQITDFCFFYEKEGASAKGCLDEVSWDLGIDVLVANIFNKKDALEITSYKPIKLLSKRIKIGLPPKKQDQNLKQAQDENEPPDVYGLWKMAWHKLIPDIVVALESVLISSAEGESFELSAALKKIGQELEANSLGFILKANPSEIKLAGPPRYELPVEVPMIGKVSVDKSLLVAKISEQNIKVKADAMVLGIHLDVQTKLGLPLRDQIGSPAFIKSLAMNTKARATIKNLRERVEKEMDPAIGGLPAPINALEGDLKLYASAGEALKRDEIELKLYAASDLNGPKQAIVFDTLLKLVLDVKSMKPGAMFVDVNLKNLLLQIPRMPKNALPPQFMPDGRIYTEELEYNKELAKSELQKPQGDKPALDLNMRIQAKGAEALGFRTNLLEKPIRLNTDLKIEKGKLKGGYIETLPLKTTFFKRKIALRKFHISFKDPENPTLDGKIQFLLPEYTVSVYLEGPLSAPRHYLESEPPLPEEDIYAVLLFGRPMIDLEGSDKNAAEKTNDVLSQGVLSVGVLYFLSDTPIQAILYDPDSEQLSAQFALGDKRSLTVGKGSVGVKQSLGNGWYVNTSSDAEEGYGVMLERILAY